MSEEWIELSMRTKPVTNQEVLGWNKYWVNEDYNPDGICLCFLDDEGVWTIAVWCGTHDEWHTWEHNIPYKDRNGIKPAPTHWRPKPLPPITNYTLKNMK